MPDTVSLRSAAEEDYLSETASFEFTFHKSLDVAANIEADDDPSSSGSPSMNRSLFLQDGESLTESIFNYHKENGRTYHAYRAGSYYFPNDDKEIERLENQFELLRICLDGRNYLAPWTMQNPPHKVLDVGTGTGRWAIEMGDEFPTAEIVGIDLSPIQPTMVPPNVNFFVEDATEDWQEEDLDYIHTRITLGCWSDMKAELIEKSFRKLRPGGWLEMQEVDGLMYCDDDSMPPDLPLVRWMHEVIDAGARAGRPLTKTECLGDLCKQTGFVDVHEKIFKLPINDWPRDRRLKSVGKLWQANLLLGLQAFCYGLLHRVCGQSKEEIEVALINVRKDIYNTRHHGYNRLHVIWAQKPHSDVMS